MFMCFTYGYFFSVMFKLLNLCADSNLIPLEADESFGSQFGNNDSCVSKGWMIQDELHIDVRQYLWQHNPIESPVSNTQQVCLCALVFLNQSIDKRHEATLHIMEILSIQGAVLPALVSRPG